MEKLSLRVKLRRYFKSLKRDAEWKGWVKTILCEVPFYRKLQDFKWFVLHRTFKRYDRVVLKDLKPDYYDIDKRLVYANFSLLCEFIEKENPFERIDWNSDDEHKHAASEMKRLYAWWKESYLKREDNDPLFKVDLTRPKEPKDIVIQVDKDGDPTLYEWVGNDDPDFHKACLDSREFNIKIEKELEDNLISLIKIRNYLWT